ncbi:cell division regulator GpsB [Virgibacillus sp. AGTR]|uniref:Cell cycle protein GpsB n=1 Tax=Virgibacillus salarius TaxID=447199 RepID=A0A941ICW6_9BACI|nr:MULTISPECIES: cell division regulator GpsB [Bacillaceae]NAZ09284.1 cell division regulator GpsB [Agaribacter marinus]MBR7796575.1 cell division regulator GpsB [Virgibacillus salarius]MCC2250900.1 cell division regulator GpsB [Virgibacillus sp. AGTR]MDY7042590.1 cell division regulator GpsB [Virgibacillus sp. M23]QRZ17059.1 cell division regulator GpsB [Virgibacillus sp. AGTR]
MSTNRVQLSSKDILEKDFKTAMRGYNQEEVDEFLDLIIQDYDAFKQELERLQQENDRLKKSSTVEQPPKTRSAQPNPNPQVNYDVLKRLSNLEKAVFGKKFAETES